MHIFHDSLPFNSKTSWRFTVIWVKDHRDNEKNLLLILHGILFHQTSSKGSFIFTISHTGYVIVIAFITPVV